MRRPATSICADPACRVVLRPPSRSPRHIQNRASLLKQRRSQQHRRRDSGAGASNGRQPHGAGEPAPMPAAEEQTPAPQLEPASTAARTTASKSGLVIPHGRELEGFACLLMVSFLWGSYGPALRVAYNLPGPPTPAAVTAISAALELIMLLSIALVGAAAGRGGSAGPSAANAGAKKAAAGEALTRGAAAEAPRRWLGLPAPLLAGLEVGLYNAAANWCEIASLALITATRSAFLLQAALLFTPILSTFTGIAVGRSVWMGSMLALTGTAIITQDPSGAAASDALAAAGRGLGLTVGDTFALLAALFYSFATVRLPVWALQHGVTPLQLAIGKSSVFTAAGAAAAGVQMVQLMAADQPVAALWPGWQQPAGWAIMLWAALGPGALANVLVVMGQGLIAPTPARIILCGVPLFAAFISAAVLPGEVIGLLTWVGGSMVAAAGLVAALVPGGRRVAHFKLKAV